jgi:hypothetical protein
MTFNRIVLVVSAYLAALSAAPPPADLAHQKLARIESGELPAGTRIVLSGSELNAWAVDEALRYAPGATRNIRLRLATNGATASMLLDFLKLRQASTSEDPGWLMRNLFAGERPITVAAHFESRNHRARVMLDRVEISGVLIEGATLDFLVRNWLRPTFPDVKINEWFDLGYRIDSFTVTPSVVSVLIGK